MSFTISLIMLELLQISKRKRILIFYHGRNQKKKLIFCFSYHDMSYTNAIDVYINIEICF